MTQLLTYPDIDPQQWQALVDSSPYATWFQTKEAYEFYAAVGGELIPFAFGVVEEYEGDEAMRRSGDEAKDRLVGVIVGYITRERNPIKQLLTCRSIIIGGPLLDEDISDEALGALLGAVKNQPILYPSLEGRTLYPLKQSPFPLGEGRGEAYPSLQGGAGVGLPIYIESRNFHDYSRWRTIFESNGFAYHPHLNFHVDTTSKEIVDKNLGKSRKRDIRTTIREGVTPVMQPTIEQVREYYQILHTLYTTKVKTPLFSWHFFEQLYHTEHARFILTEYQGRIIGGTVCVELPNRALYEWFACGEDGVYDHIYPSCYATYLGIQYAAESGCQIFDMMGVGKPDEAYGVRDFKAKFGGELVEYGRFLCIRKPLLYWIGKMGVKWLKRKR